MNEMFPSRFLCFSVVLVNPGAATRLTIAQDLGLYTAQRLVNHMRKQHPGLNYQIQPVYINLTSRKY